MKNTLSFIIIQIVILLIWATGWILIEYYVPVEDAGAFGDQFGALTSLFSAIAFGGIVYSIIIQTRELILTRQEFAKTTHAQLVSSNALISQLNIQKKVATVSAITTLLKHYEENQHLKLIDFENEANFAVKRAEFIQQINDLLIEIKEFNIEQFKEFT